MSNRSISLLTPLSSIGLSLMRVIASQLVLVGHSIGYFKLFPAVQPPNFEYMQNIAVVLFFILSGFFISYSIYNKMKLMEYTFLDYFIDRFSRIYTGFIPAIFLILGIDSVNRHLTSNYAYDKAFNCQTFIGNLFMLQDFPYTSYITSFGSARPFWTIAIEWWIYLSFGWIILHIAKKRINIYSVLILFLFSIVPFYNLLRASRGHGLTFVWLMGAICLFVLTKLKNINVNYKQLIINLMISLLFLFFAFKRIDATKSAYGLGFALLVSMAFFFFIMALQQSYYEPKSIYKKTIGFVANYSFTLYLIHYSIVDLIHNLWFGKVPAIYLLLLAFISSNLIAASLALVTEMKHKKVAVWLKSHKKMAYLPKL